MSNQASLRQQIRKIRQQISVADREQLSKNASNIFLSKLKNYHQIKKIAVYFSMPEELDTAYLIRQLWQRNITTFLPAIDQSTKLLTWRKYQEKSLLIKDLFDIFVVDDKNYLGNFDLVLLPLVAFNNYGYRMGMGGGYYDKYFASAKKPLFWGLAYQFQQVEFIANSWDLRLNAVFTPDNAWFFG